MTHHKVIFGGSLAVFFALLIGAVWIRSLGLPVVNAISGACFGHAGVNCGLGMDRNGHAICNDSTIDASADYLTADECKDNNLYASLANLCASSKTEWLDYYQKQYQSILDSMMDVYDAKVPAPGPAPAVITFNAQGMKQCYDAYGAGTDLAAQCIGALQAKADQSFNAFTQYNNKLKAQQNDRAHYLLYTAHPQAVVTAMKNVRDLCNGNSSVGSGTQQGAGFTDISWYRYASAITFLQQNGLLKGYDDGSFKPNNRVNRAEFTKIFMQTFYPDEAAAFVPSACYKDVSADAWYANSVCFAKDKGFIIGYRDGTFRPAQNITVSETFSIAKKTGLAITGGLTLPEWSVASHEITRGELAEFVYKIKQR